MGHSGGKKLSKRRRASLRPAGSRQALGQDLLIEILTEELPPSSLRTLSEAMSKAVYDGLKQKDFLTEGSTARPYATPRRLAVLVTGVLPRQPNRVLERRGPAVSAGLDAAGKPTPALLGFAKSCDIKYTALGKQAGDKGEYFIYRAKQKGESLKVHLQTIVESSLKKLPAPKLMRWGQGDIQFIRPVHGLVMLYGKQVIPGTALGQKSDRKTHGHRFMSRGPITIKRAGDYQAVLRRQGNVIACFDERTGMIEKQLNTQAEKIGKTITWRLGKGSALIDEVASLVEYPVVYAGEFNEAFLSVPKECLIISMQQHQRYFPLANRKEALLNRFLFVSNIKPRSPKLIIEGNERVLKARLEDAKFFFEQDKKVKLADRVPKLANVVFHNKLGSQLERVQRIKKLAMLIASLLKVDIHSAETAADLCKADLLTDMVGEFPELQGVMGYYYARHEGLADDIAIAIRSHYSPRYADDKTPLNPVGTCVALADKLDTLVGIYGIGLAPTGEKDPYGLRRQALGVVRILAEEGLSLDVQTLLQKAAAQFQSALLSETVVDDLHSFMIDRLRPYLRDKDFAADEIEAVLHTRPAHLDKVVPRLKALQEFRKLPQAESLAAANKRIRNILRQAAYVGTDVADDSLYKHDVERYLANAINEQREVLQPVLAEGDYTLALKSLAGLRGVVDDFFDQVMVMVDDEKLRNNRLALLHNLNNLFMKIADISRLQS